MGIMENKVETTIERLGAGLSDEGCLEDRVSGVWGLGFRLGTAPTQ